MAYSSSYKIKLQTLIHSNWYWNKQRPFKHEPRVFGHVPGTRAFIPLLIKIAEYSLFETKW